MPSDPDYKVDAFDSTPAESPGQHESTLPIGDVRAHMLEVMTHGRSYSQLDRSKYFRYPHDVPALRAHARASFEKNIPLEVLMIGIGNGEEPLSYLSALHLEAKECGIRLQDCTQVHLVEIRPKEEVAIHSDWGTMVAGGMNPLFLTEEEKKHATFVPRKPPSKMESAFAFSSEHNEFEFHPDIQQTLQQAMQDPTKGHFSTPIENYITAGNENQFDIVSCNNVLQHLGGTEGYASPYKNPRRAPEDYTLFAHTLRGIMKKVKPGGLFILHTDGASLTDTKGKATSTALAFVPEFYDQFEEVDSGIFRKRTSDSKSQHS